MDSTEQILLQIRQKKATPLKITEFHNPNPPGQLRWWQQVQVAHILGRMTHFVGDLTGLGKTATVLTAYGILRSRYPHLRLLVIATKTASVTWGDEIPRWLQGVPTFKTPSERKSLSKIPAQLRWKYRGVSGEDYRKLEAYEPWHKNGGILVVNYTQVRKEFATILDPVLKDNLMVVCDEAAAFKGSESNIRKAMEEVRKKAARFYAMSATIIKNRLDEARSIIDIMVPGLLPKLAFEKCFCVMEDQEVRVHKGRRWFTVNVKKIVGYQNLDEFKKLIEPYYLGYRDDDPDIARELPDLQNRIIRIDLDSAQQDFLDKLHDSAIKKYNEESGRLERVETLAALTYEQIFLGDAALLEDVKEVPQGENHKLEALKDLLENDLAGEKVVIYTHFEKIVTSLEQNLTAAGFKVSRITGKESSEQRKAARDSLVVGKTQVLIIDDAGGESLNVQMAKAVIFYDLPWSAGDYSQIVGRIRRLNATDPEKLVYHLLVKGSIDEYKWEILLKKFDLIEKIYNGKGVLMGVGELGVDAILERMKEDAHATA